MKSINTYIQLLLAALMLTISAASCNKYLNIPPEGLIPVEGAYKDVPAINARLNSIYIGLAHNNLYGRNITMSTLETLGQRFNLNFENELYQLSLYNYADKESLRIMDNIWSTAYSNIFNINEFIASLDMYYLQAGLSTAQRDIYAGEAIAARAFIHFDLLRLFGPVYAVDSLNTAIAYNANTETVVKELLPANELIKAVIADLKLAEGLLAQDPIIQEGVMPETTIAGNNFMRRRNYRFNYFAVKALQARVHLYRQDKVSTHLAAMELIKAAEIFPWTTVRNAISDKQNPDRVYSTEMIMGVLNSNLYSNFTRYFSPSLTDKEILSSNPSRVVSWFEGNEHDYRYLPQWVTPTDGSKTYPTNIKFQDINDNTKPYRFTIPLIKLSEMYLIAAETAADPASALAYLNILRNKRGIFNLDGQVNLSTELLKEYRKEFFGEGQLFFFYKRKNVSSIPNGALNSGNISMSSNTYKVPLPISETFPRQ